MTIEDRPRGILSPADREYLKHPEEYSDQAAYERRQAIVTRVHEAFHDFPLLVSRLEEERRREAFGDRDLENKDHTINVLSSAFAFLYLGITDTVGPEELAKDAFEDLIGDGVRNAYLQRGVSVDDVTVTIEVDTGPTIEELKEEENPDTETLFQLFRAGEVSLEEMEEYVEFTPLEDDP